MTQTVKSEAAQAASTPASESPPAANDRRTSLDERLQALRAHQRDPQQLCKAAEGLLTENEKLRQVVRQTRRRQARLRTEFDALCAPENYSAVITRVNDQRPPHVEVYVPGISRLCVAVHPSVDRKRLKVGARGRLAKNRNCLLAVSDAPPDWRDVCVFERYLAEDRILVKHQEQLVALTLCDDLRGVPLAHGDQVGCDREGAALACTRLPDSRGTHLFLEDTPSDNFAELGGLDREIRRLKRAIDFAFLHPTISDRYHLARKRGILLEGPPGNGKTRLARCVASYLGQLMPGVGCRFQCVVGSQDYSMWLGGTESRLRERFAAARDAAKSGPCVMFFDEIDAFCRRRGTDLGSSAPDRILSTFLGQVDGVVKTLANVILIAATNRADQLDPALIRPGRFDLKIAIPPPGRSAAAAILGRYLNHDLPLIGDAQAMILTLLSRMYSPRGEYSVLARVRLSDNRTLEVSARELLSGAMLEQVVHRAAEAAACREVESGHEGGVAEQDLLAALDDELTTAVRLLTPSNVKSFVMGLPRDSQPVEVIQLARRQARFVAVA